jgi:3',5'-cyclic AMP phosphodiesterase CpdA
MKTRCLTAILCAILWATVAHAQTSMLPELPSVPGTGKLTDDPKATQFTFIAAGDNRPAKKNAIKQPKTLAHIIKDSKQFKPVFILWSGDTIAGFRTPQKIHHKTLEAQYEEFFRHAAKAGVPMFNSPGNHEMDVVNKSKTETVETPDPQMQALYLKMMEYPQGAPPYGAFNYGNSRFIAVDTEEVPPITAARSEGGSGAKKLKLDPGFVSMQQMELLAADLEANKDKDHIFVFMHHPIMALKKSMQLNQENADQLQTLFTKHKNVSYVIAAHEHLYFNASGDKLKPPSKTSDSPDGPVYLVSGGAGAPLGNCPKHARNCSNSHHYLVFEVNGKKVDVKVVMIPKKSAKS